MNPTDPAPAEQWLRWDPDEGFGPATAPGGPLLAADSWLVEDGRVRDVGRHAERFSRACAREGVAERARVDFWRDVLARLPRRGAWFPRVELRPGGALSLWLRHAPHRGAVIRVLPWPHADPRAMPYRKGPDLDLLAGIRRRAQEAGADDALLSTADGAVTESTTASPLWWRGDTLCLPPPGPHLLPGVTSALVVQLARWNGVPVRQETVSPAELFDCETWLVNALYGIRPVTDWVGVEHPAAPAERAPRWQRLLTALASDLPAAVHRPAPQGTITQGGTSA
ncbi:aminotransferase class IV [Streptomyces sp. AJS327]|uniref:aminotransferase class IV n=1 Tax=Streptomyces sp. AJS327 TaxID=2545265 RepID=UPI0015DDE151|nr:aminotransferase class IV [Streptomyces sp. AJS327]MBA0051245.1 aminotransferase class IV [Streptomyces sp. AJS327]